MVEVTLSLRLQLERFELKLDSFPIDAMDLPDTAGPTGVLRRVTRGLQNPTGACKDTTTQLFLFGSHVVTDSEPSRIRCLKEKKKDLFWPYANMAAAN